MKKINDKEFLKARAKAGAAARWDNHNREVWDTIRVSRTVKNRLLSLQASTPSKAIEGLITLYYWLFYLDKNNGLNKKTAKMFEAVKNSFKV